VADAGALLALFGGVAGVFVADAAVFAAVRRASPPARRGLAHSIAGLAALALAAVYFIASTIPAPWVIPGLVMVACNSYIGFHLDNMAETARRIRILRELDEAPRGLSREAILAAYSPREVFELRIRRLKLAGQCIEDGGSLKMIGTAYSFMGNVVAWVGRIVFGAARRTGGQRKL
jgi:hypothetical protein